MAEYYVLIRIAKIEYNIIKNNSVEIELADASAMGGGIFCGPPSNSGLYSIIYKNRIWSNNVITSGISSNWDKGWAQGGGIIILYDGLVTENDIYLNHCEAAYGYAVGGGVRIMGGATDYSVNNLLHYNDSISTSSYAFAGGVSRSAANTVIDSNEILNNFIAGIPDCRGGGYIF